MNRLQQAWIWLRRIAHCRGFGIQSPTDYRFVRYVVNEHWPYYAYAELGKNDDWVRRKLGRLYFRLANFIQPAVIVDLLGYEDYLQAGCRKARISRSAAEPASLILAPGDAPCEQLMEAARQQAVVVVQDIWQHPDNWQRLLAHPLATIAFDLYYCGIVLTDPKRTKQSYIVNF